MLELDELVAPPDGVTLARTVRAVAAQARRTLRRSGPSEESRELLSAISGLEQDARSLPSTDLSAWLASLRRKVENHGWNRD